jgi:hypothetical protein
MACIVAQFDLKNAFVYGHLSVALFVVLSLHTVGGNLDHLLLSPNLLQILRMFGRFLAKPFVLRVHILVLV